MKYNRLMELYGEQLAQTKEPVAKALCLSGLQVRSRFESCCNV